MREKSVAEKAHVKAGTSFACIAEEADVVTGLGFPASCAVVPAGEASIVLLFVRDRQELEARMPAAIRELRPDAALWVFFRRGSRAAGRDMNRNDVWAIAERHEMRPLGLNSVDDSWSVFRLRR